MLQKYHSIFDGKLSKKVEATEAEAIGLPLNQLLRTFWEFFTIYY